MRRYPEDMLSVLMKGVGAEIEERQPIEDGPMAISSMEALCLLFDQRTATAIAREDQIDLPSRQVPDRCWSFSGAARYWKPWAKPNPALPIDDCVSDLIAGWTRKNSPKMVGRDEFFEIGLMRGEGGGHECPYEYVRHELARAVGLAYDDLKNDDIRRNELPMELDQIAEWCKQINNKAARLLERVDEIGFAPPPALYVEKTTGHLDDRYTTKRHAENIRSAIATFEGVAASAKEKRATLVKGGRPEEVWWVSFIIRCGIIWTTLTGSVPNKGQRAFEDFIRAANKSLGGRRSEFDSQIDTALLRVGKMENWNKFDTDFKAVHPPAWVSLEILGPLSSDFWNSKNRHLLKAAALVVRARQGDCEAAADLQAVLAGSSDEGRGRIAELMARQIKTPRFSGGGTIN